MSAARAIGLTPPDVVLKALLVDSLMLLETTADKCDKAELARVEQAVSLMIEQRASMLEETLKDVPHWLPSLKACALALVHETAQRRKGPAQP